MKKLTVIKNQEVQSIVEKGLSLVGIKNSPVNNLEKVSSFLNSIPVLGIGMALVDLKKSSDNIKVVKYDYLTKKEEVKEVKIKIDHENRKSGYEHKALMKNLDLEGKKLDMQDKELNSQSKKLDKKIDILDEIEQEYIYICQNLGVDSEEAIKLSQRKYELFMKFMDT